MAVPFLDLKPQYALIQKEIEKAVLEICRSQQFVLGKPVAQFEEAFAAYCDVPFAVGVASGTDALILALKAIGVELGDEVITTPFTFIATAGAISLAGAKPVFVDIDPTTFNLNPVLVKEKITPKTKAILPIHMFGLPVEMKPLQDLANEVNLSIIEDACQAVGARYQGKRTGGLGKMGCFSFFPTKNLGGYGDGGIITTGDEEIAKKLKMLRVHGSQERYRSDMVGFNSRLDAIQAAVLNVKLNYIDLWNTRRREIAQVYSEQFKNLPLELPQEPKGREHVYHQYTLQVDERDKCATFLKEQDIGSSIYYPVPLHLQGCYSSLGYKEGDFPQAEKVAQRVLSLPIYPELTEEQLKEVVHALEAFHVQVG